MTLLKGSLLKEISDGDERLLLFYCPACEMTHPYRLSGKGPKWSYNGNPEKPSFTPSLRVHNMGPNNDKDCHLYVTNGEIRYCGDSWHGLAGKTVPLGLFRWDKTEEPGTD